MDSLLREGLDRALETIAKIRKADQLTVVYYRFDESVEVGVFDQDEARYDAVQLKALLAVADREIEFEDIFAEPNKGVPIIQGSGQQRIADLLGKPVAFYRRYGGKEKNYLDNSSKEVFQPRTS